MPFPGLFAGLEEGLASEVATQRKATREREDREFTQNLQILEQLRQDPRTTPEMYQRVLQDTLKLHAGQNATRKPKSGLKGFLGQTDTAPYHSDILDNLASGQIPVFQDRQAFDTARTGTADDLRNHVAGQVSGQGGAPAPAVAPPPGPMPPSANGAIPPLGDQTSYLSAFHPKNPDAPISGQVNSATPAAGPVGPQAAPAGPAGAGAGAPPPGPVPSPPGTGHMMNAASGLSSTLSTSGPVLPTPPTSTDIMARHRTSPSAFFNPEEMGQMKASGETQNIPYQAKADYDALIAAGMSPQMATLAVARKLTGFAGGMTSAEGPWFVGPDNQPFKSILQKDNYGNFQHVHPQTGELLGPDYHQVDPTANQIVTDAQGNLRVVSKLGGQASNKITDPTGATKLGKPYTPPPHFQSVQVVAGQNGEPQFVGLPRGGGNLVPLQIGGTATGTPPPPQPGQAPTVPPTPATKFVMPKTLSDAQSKAITAGENVKGAAQRALAIIDEMEAQGENMSNPIGQTIDLWLVRHGWDPGELQEQLFQNVGYQEINAMNVAGMGGRPNTRMIDIFQNHVGQPGSSLSLLRTQLKGLIDLSDKAEQNVLKVASTYRQQPWPTVHQTPPAGGPTVPPPPPKWSNAPAK